MNQNPIPAVKALTRMQEIASSHQHSVASGHTAKVTHAKNSVSFTVLASNSQQLTLQDNANKQRFNLPASAINTANLPKSGDTLVLLSANTKTLNFSVVPSQLRQFNQQGFGQPLTNKLQNAVVETWPDISKGVANKASLSVAAYLSIDSSDTKLSALARALTANAIKLGQPLIELPVMAKIISMSGKGETLSALAQVQMSGLNSKALQINLPIPTRLASTLKNTDNVFMTLSVNNINAGVSKPHESANMIKSIQTQSGVNFSQNEIAKVNASNRQLSSLVQSISEKTLFTFNKPTSASGSDANKHQFLISNLQNGLIKLLPQGLLEQIQKSLPPSLVEEARLLITSTSKTSLNSTQMSTGSQQITLSAIAKPQILQMQSSVLNTKFPQGDLQAFEQDIIQRTNAQKTQGTGDISLQSEASVSPNNTRLNADASQSGLIKNSLLLKLQQTMSQEALANVSLKIQSALNHTMAHSEPSAPVLEQVKTSLEQVIQNGSKETRSELTPLLKQLTQILDKPLHGQLNGQINGQIHGQNHEHSHAKAKLDAKIADGLEISNTQKPAPLQNIELNDSVDTDLPDMLRSALSAQAVTQINQAIGPSKIGGQNNFVEGLVSLLKLSLATKLASPSAHSSSSAARSTELLPVLISFAGNVLKQTNPKADKTLSARVLQDIAAGDPRGSLISGIGKLLSSHNTHKLRAAEATLQGQDTYFYALPNVMNKQGEDIEIAIKRDKNDKDGNDGTSGASTWRLDMKLDVGKHGTVLAKTVFATKTNNQGIDLHLYASNDALKSRVLRYLPYLSERLAALGIVVNSQKCDVGKVDDTLFKTQLNVMHAYA
ncbi:hypothetical protein ACFO4O_08015 [Glaciecola siphonariae]|uniref:Flagellar hook-length control protein-like C-terminal domain-containing protein n=1 Tax=Glaciecola siphonariae TaxID=521012 RepID=A0ABV9LUX5_9ALTE